MVTTTIPSPKESYALTPEVENQIGKILDSMAAKSWCDDAVKPETKPKNQKPQERHSNVRARLIAYYAEHPDAGIEAARKACNCSYNSVVLFRKKSGIAEVKGPSKKSAILALAEAEPNLTSREIAERVGSARSHVTDVLRLKEGR